MPAKPETRWEVVNIETAELDTAVSMHFTLRNERGEPFVVSVTGPGAADAGSFIQALRMSEFAIRKIEGSQTPTPDVREVAKPVLN